MAGPLSKCTSTRWKLAPVAAVVLAALVAVAAGSRQARSAPSAPPVEHVVILFQENHSFDDTLGKLCATMGTRHEPCDGATTGKLHDGRTIRLAREPDVVPAVFHSVESQRAAIDGGKMDGFDLIKGCEQSAGNAWYAQFGPRQIPNLAALARKFVISDRTFGFASTPSWAGHMVLASATLDGFLGDNPWPSKYSPPPGPGWGCDSKKDEKWWNGKAYVQEPACIPDEDGDGPYRASPVPYVPTIFDRLGQAGLTWRIYGGVGHPGQGYGWTICPTFFECLGSSQRTNLVAATKVIGDAQAGTLPAFSIVTPTGPNSQHNGFSMTQGDNWIGDVVGAIMNGPDWASTVVFVTYDDCGCFYDHVAPPAPGAGLREPMVIVSPFARRGFTDSRTASFMSMLAYTEHLFGLPPLNQNDASAYDYADAFDYGQQPLEPIRMTRAPVPASARAWIAAHPPDPDDPT
jgi:phospholipase C